MKAFTRRIESPAHRRWMEAIVLDLKTHRYSRLDLDAMGVGLHTIAAARLSRILKSSGSVRTLPDIYNLGLSGLLSLGGIGEISAIVVSHCLDAEGFNVFKWIGAKGRSYKGAIANAKAKAGRGRRARSS